MPSPDQIVEVCRMSTQQLHQAWKSDTSSNSRFFAPYVVYTVSITFQGRSVGPYTALAMFGRDDKGKEVAEIMDNVIDNVMINGEDQYYPAILTRMPWRELPVVQEWLSSTSVDDNMNPGHVACDDTHCGISKSDLHADLSVPLVYKQEARRPASENASPSCTHSEFDGGSAWTGLLHLQQIVLIRFGRVRSSIAAAHHG